MVRGEERCQEELKRFAAEHRAAWGERISFYTVLTLTCNHWNWQVTQDEERHHEELKRFAAQHRAAWEVDVEERRRLDKMAEEKDAFAAQITTRRSAEFEALQVWTLFVYLYVIRSSGCFCVPREMENVLGRVMSLTACSYSQCGTLPVNKRQGSLKGPS